MKNLSRRRSERRVELILQPFRHFTYVTTLSNPSVALPTLQLILQPLFRFYVTMPSLNSPGETPINCTFFLCNDSRISSRGTEWKAAVDLKMPCVLIFHRQFTFWEIVRFHALSGYVDIPDKSIIPYRASWLRGNARDSYSGGPGFESQCRPT